MSGGAELLGLTAAVARLVSELVAAIRAGDRERAAELAEEAARRQALILARRARSAGARGRGR